jgi:short-subunit dehydrogenase
MKIQGKVIVVTGGGSGMGRGLVLGLLKKGARIIAVDINPTALEETASLAPNNRESLSTIVLDITNREAVEEASHKMIRQFGVVDGLINNAGIIQPFVRINDLDYQVIERVMNVNFYGTLYMTKAFLPHLLTRPEAYILNISSMGGFLPVPGQSVYGAAKAAVKLFTEALHSELADSNIHVTVVIPGAINTNIKANSGLADEPESKNESHSNRILSPLKAANIIIEGMENNRHRILVGKDAKWMDFMYWLNPKFASKFIYRMMKSKLS